MTIMPDPEEGFAADRVTVTDQDGNPVEITENGDGTWSFIQPDSSVTISVTYRQIEEELPFRDVSEDAWYEESVRYVYENGLMVGSSDTEFHPDVITSRSMLVTTLWRMAGSPSAGGPIPFDDVNEEAWYAEAVRWAAGEGIVNGYSSGIFAPDDTLTREQMAEMLYRFAGYMGYDISGAADLSGYSDTEEISGYAARALSWAGAEGLINGMSDTVLAPKGSATRAQMAAILMRFCERYEDAG